jgi:hypothetical protein
MDNIALPVTRYALKPVRQSLHILHGRHYDDLYYLVQFKGCSLTNRSNVDARAGREDNVNEHHPKSCAVWTGGIS